MNENFGNINEKLNALNPSNTAAVPDSTEPKAPDPQPYSGFTGTAANDPYAAAHAGQTYQSYQGNPYYFNNFNNAANTAPDMNRSAQPDAFAGNTASPGKVKKKKEKSRRSGGGRIVAVALCCAVLGGAIGAVGNQFAYSYLNKDDSSESSGENASSGKSVTILESDRESVAVNTASVESGEEMTAAEVYASNVNSTVGITVDITTNYFGYTTTAAASGSGFILTEDGYILTNYHVIEDGSNITVTMYDDTSYAAEVVGYDESNDIAVIKVDAEDLTPVVLGSSDNLNVGDSVIAIGNPLGELTFSLTSGTVSALGREVTLSNGTMTLIQTDCAINSGNSGGALFNMYGEVVGITNAKYSGSGSSSEASIDNIGFAIPIDSVRSMVESIIEYGYVIKPYIGVTVTDVSSQSIAYGLPEGAAVASVTEDSPAQEAGLQENDIITSVNGEEITGSSDLVSIVQSSSAGDVLKLSVYRQGETLELEITVAETKQTMETEDSGSAYDQYGGMYDDYGDYYDYYGY